MNPWISIWTQPRATIRHVIDTDITKHVIPLAMVGGIFGILDRAPDTGLSDELGPLIMIVIALFVGPLGGIAGLYIGGALLRWGGQFIGGVGESDEIRAALAWPYVIYCIGFVMLIIPQVAIAGLEAFTFSTPNLDARAAADPQFEVIVAGVYIFAGLLAIIMGIWYVVVGVKCLGEAHQFSAWKALVAFIIGYGVVCIPLATVILAFTRL